MWKRRIQLARIYQNKFRFYGIVKFGNCNPFIDRRSIDVQDKLEIGPNDPRLHEACKKAWDELEEKQIENISSGGCPSWSSWWENTDGLGTELVDEKDCLHIQLNYHQKWVSAIEHGKCLICGRNGF